MIPKKIHYCWFGRGPKGKLFDKCLKSWKKYFPDYEIIEWNEDNFDVHQNKFMDQAYSKKKYAFVSDYARLKILYDNGGIYFDTDVEALKRIDDDILSNGFFAKEIDEEIATGLGFAVPKNNKFIKMMMEEYENKDFLDENGNIIIDTCCRANTRALEKNGYIVKDIDNLDGIRIYDKNYFCGFDVITNHYIISDKTFTVHHYAGSWNPTGLKVLNKIKRLFSSIIGVNNYNKLRKIKFLFKRNKL